MDKICNTMTIPSNAPKRRAILIRNANSFDFGGAERFVVSLAKELDKNNWDAIVVSRHQKILEHAHTRGVQAIRGWWWSRQDWSGKRILLTPIYFLWQGLLCLWYLQLFLRLRPDVVHPQSKDDFIAATIAGKWAGCRIIWTDHADLKYMYQNVPVRFKNPIGKWLFRVSRRADAITFVSKSEQNLVGNALGQPATGPKYHVIYNGIFDRHVVPLSRKDADKTALIFCVTSRLVTAKGIGELVDAFKQIKPQLQNTRLWILGEGPEEAKFRAQAAGDKDIVFWGFPANSMEILGSTDVFVHPSYHEGFSLSIVEAAMLARPIIACNVGGNPEIIQDGHNGLLIPPKDSAALAGAMLKLAKDKSLRQTLGQAARRQYVEKFQFDKIVEQRFIPLYEAK
jgi:glycosyltransferase involved in cell wall biosynthesis